METNLNSYGEKTDQAELKHFFDLYSRILSAKDYSVIKPIEDQIDDFLKSEFTITDKTAQSIDLEALMSHCIKYSKDKLGYTIACFIAHILKLSDQIKLKFIQNPNTLFLETLFFHSSQSHAKPASALVSAFVSSDSFTTQAFELNLVDAILIKIDQLTYNPWEYHDCLLCISISIHHLEYSQTTQILPRIIEILNNTLTLSIAPYVIDNTSRVATSLVRAGFAQELCQTPFFKNLMEFFFNANCTAFYPLMLEFIAETILRVTDEDVLLLIPIDRIMEIAYQNDKVDFLLFFFLQFASNARAMKAPFSGRFLDYEYIDWVIGEYKDSPSSSKNQIEWYLWGYFYLAEDLGIALHILRAGREILLNSLVRSDEVNYGEVLEGGLMSVLQLFSTGALEIDGEFLSEAEENLEYMVDSNEGTRVMKAIELIKSLQETFIEHQKTIKTHRK